MKHWLLLCLLLTGCAAKMPAPSESPRTEQLTARIEAASEGGGVSEVKESDRVIVSSAELRLETENPDSVHRATIEYAYAHQGYVLSSDAERTSIRIPASDFQTALVDLEDLGTLLDKSINSDDVSTQYFDLQTRLANAEKTREQYLQLLARAGSMSEIMAVERELERINQLIETYKGQFNRIAHRTWLSTVTVNTRQKGKPGPVGYAFVQAYKGVKWLFVRD